MARHTVACKCGHANPIRLSSAGMQHTCVKCHSPFTAPVLSQLVQLPVEPVPDTRWFEIEPKALPNRWQFSIRHVLITTAITAVVVLLGTFALNRIIDTSTPRLGYVKNSRVFDEPIDDSASVSNDLDGDKRMMWCTQPSCSGEFCVSPVSAINASRRVFETLRTQLVGKDRDQIQELIGYDERPDYGYNGAFFGVKKHAYVYRFDCGNFGWQYNLYLNDEKIVTNVEYLWIH